MDGSGPSYLGSKTKLKTFGISDEDKQISRDINEIDHTSYMYLSVNLVLQMIEFMTAV